MTIHPKHWMAAALTGLCLALPGQTAAQDGFSGPYLAGRAAIIDNDLVAMARYFERVIAADPANIPALESAVTANVALGAVDQGLVLAGRLERMEPENPIAGLVRQADLALAGQWDELLERIEQGRGGGPLVDMLAASWAEAGRGNMAAALDNFDRVIATDGLEGFGRFHKALALAMVGDLEAAEAILGAADETALVQTKRVVLARAAVLAGLDQSDRALEVLGEYMALDPAPAVLAMHEQLTGGGAPPMSLAADPLQGLAEVYYGIGQALMGETEDTYVLMHARLAEYMNPAHADAILLGAALLEEMGQFELATGAYDRIARDDPAFFDAELGRAEAMRLAGSEEAAVEVLTRLAESYPEQAIAHVALGDLLRGLQRYAEATLAYDRALALYSGDEPGLWFVYYTRGITHEREDNWEQAEADFRKALELNPDQPSVLNYIGYSFVEMQTNLDEALDMIRKAVELRPNDGYITDSLGWAYYRLDQFDEAVTWMEKAVELMPIDPIVNDHLGDVYWMVDRKREARFQWNRAMSFEPEEEDAARIRRKLEVGLDVVLAEEGADPISVANGN